MGQYIRVATREQVPEGRGLTIRAAGREIALFNCAGQIYALDGRCPHRGGLLGEGMLEGESVHCPLHGWNFDLRTGQCADRPDRPAQRFAVRERAGHIEVEIPTN